ncbi:hypothetical protein D3C76_859190 [compost metagenome]
MRHAAHVPELHEDQTAGLVHLGADFTPGLHLFIAVDSRRPGIALALPGNLRRLGNDQRGARTLAVILGIHGRWNVARLSGARACQRRHRHSVRECVRAQCDGLEQVLRHEVFSSIRKEEAGRGRAFGQASDGLKLMRGMPLDNPSETPHCIA